MRALPCVAVATTSDHYNHEPTHVVYCHKSRHLVAAAPAGVVRDERDDDVRDQRGSAVVDVEPEMPLLWVLRDVLGLFGTKYGCGVGVCGACTVHLDGDAVRSCTVPVAEVAGRHVTTIEGLSSDGGHPVQRAWLAEDVAQCGYCQAGQIITAAALCAGSRGRATPTSTARCGDNVCRCGTYQRIRAAIRRAAEGGPGERSPRSDR